MHYETDSNSESLTNYVGLFGSIGTSGIVSNLGVENVNIDIQTEINNVGGIAGYNGGKILNSYMTGTISTPAGNEIGGLVGFNSGKVFESYAEATISGASNVGGLIGYHSPGGEVRDSYAKAFITGETNVGGLIGDSHFATVEHSYSTGNVSGQNQIGGLIGRSLETTQSNNYSTSDVIANGNDAGGLLGLLTGGNIISSYALGNITGASNVGGLVGSSTGTILNGFARGNVEASSENAGGLIGSTNDSYAVTNFSYATGQVVADVYYGGLVGRSHSEADVQHSYYNNEIVNEIDTDKGTGKSTSELKDISTYELWTGFSDIWIIDPLRNDGYPQLRVFNKYVIYDGNGNTSGAVPSESIGYTRKETVTVSNNSGQLGKTNYTFDGWNTLADGSGVEYKVGDTFVITDDVTLYAQWKLKPASTSSGSTIPSNVRMVTIYAGQSGELNFEEEMNVHIPVVSASQVVNITVTKMLNPQPFIKDNDVLLSSIYDISKNVSWKFDHPITVILQFDPSKVKDNQKPALFSYDEINKVWVEVEGSTIIGNTISAQMNHVAKIAVFLVEKETASQIVSHLSDIAGHWAEESIKQALVSGIIKGYADGTFRPNGSVTRAEFAVMLANSLNLSGEGSELTFTDHAVIGAWAKKAIAQVVEQGIITGYSDGSFRANTNITRAEVAVMIARVKDAKGTDMTLRFSDAETIPAWAKAAIAYVDDVGIMQGKMDTVFKANDETTRAEAVTIILRLLALK